MFEKLNITQNCWRKGYAESTASKMVIGKPREIGDAASPGDGGTGGGLLTALIWTWFHNAVRMGLRRQGMD